MGKKISEETDEASNFLRESLNELQKVVLGVVEEGEKEISS
jgi:hypothetical protein